MGDALAESRRLVECGRAPWGEWAFKGKHKPGDREYGRRSRRFVNNVGISWVCTKGAHSAKQGGTADKRVYSSLTNVVGGDFCFSGRKVKPMGLPRWRKTPRLLF